MKLNKNTQLTILIVCLFCIIIFLIIAKINSNKNNSTDSVNSTNSNNSTDSLFPSKNDIETNSNPNYIGETNSNGDKIYYEYDSDQEFNGSEPIPSQIYPTPTTLPSQDLKNSEESEDSEEDIGDISLDFPMERYLPYEGRYFRIEKYYDVNNLEILVSDKSKTDLAKEEVKQWLIDQGDDQYDKFTIVYR